MFGVSVCAYGLGVSPNLGNPVHCMVNEFRCNDGSCIQAAYRCDNVSDCVDKSDELNCRRKFPITKVKCFLFRSFNFFCTVI